MISFNPTSVPANSHVRNTFTLSKTYQFNKTRFMICPVSYINTAYISVCGHFGADGADASRMTESNQITVFVTNSHTAVQVAGAFIYILEFI